MGHGSGSAAEHWKLTMTRLHGEHAPHACEQSGRLDPVARTSSRSSRSCLSPPPPSCQPKCETGGRFRNSDGASQCKVECWLAEQQLAYLHRRYGHRRRRRPILQSCVRMRKSIMVSTSRHHTGRARVLQESGLRIVQWPTYQDLV
jgi:hypothetical protein